MKITDFIKQTNLSNSLLLGYYGGGNFGDELLLETLLHKFSIEKFKNIKIFHMGYVDFYDYHSSFENIKVLNLKNSKFKFFWESVCSKNIIVGGGGLWGLDFNFNVLIFSLYLFFMRFVFFKKVFIVGVGFYNSTTRIGRLMGWFSAKSANIIIARDEETYVNFSRVDKNKVFLDKDIVFYLKDFINEKINVERDVERVRKNFTEENMETTNVLMVSRRFKKGKGEEYLNAIEEYAGKNENIVSTLSIMEPRHIDMHGYKIIKKIGDKFNIKYFDFNFNPLAFYFFLKKYGSDIVIIAPQYHVQLVAYLAGASFMPISYDNKCIQLFNILGIKRFYDIDKIKAKDIADFVNSRKI